MGFAIFFIKPKNYFVQKMDNALNYTANVD